MANITAQMVKELREMTQAGMMDCKKALTEAEGVMEKAIEWLREKGLAAAAKKASRIAAEMGAQFVKTYFVEEGFEKVTASCPVPIVIAGGKKLPEHEALEMCWRAIDQGASGVDMGRNIFQSSAPRAMLKAVKKVVHENLNAREAYQFWQEEKQGELK